MKKNLAVVLSLQMALFGVGCSGVPQVVKSSSHELVIAHQKFGEENERFLETVRASLGDYIDLQISELNHAKQEALEQAKKDKIDDFMTDLRKQKNLAKDAPVPMDQKDLEELTALIQQRQTDQSFIFDEGIKRLEARKTTIEHVIELLKSYHQEIQQTVVALDAYLQVEKADEVAWNGVKETLQGKNVSIDKVIQQIDDLRLAK